MLSVIQRHKADPVDRAAVGHLLPRADFNDLHQFAEVKRFADAQQHPVEQYPFNREDILQPAIELPETAGIKPSVEQFRKPDRDRPHLAVVGRRDRDGQGLVRSLPFTFVDVAQWRLGQEICIFSTFSSRLMRCSTVAR